MKNNSQAWGWVLVLLTAASSSAAVVSDFEDVVLPPAGFLDGTTGGTGFTSRGITYPWGTSFGFPIEFAVSKISDTVDYDSDGNSNTFNYEHPFNSITGGGSGGSAQYGVATALSDVELLLPASPLSIDLTNNTYAYYSMLNGDGFAKKFGGASGNEPDFFLLTITGLQGNSPLGSVEFYLADFRNSNNSFDEIVNSWRTVSLASLAGADRLRFSLSSSDNGTFGMNTPAYFALDNLTLVPEPTSFALLAMGGIAALRRGRRRARPSI